MSATIDTSGFESYIDRFMGETARMLKGEMERIPYELQADITTQMKFTQPAGGSFRSGKKLGVETGDLTRALLPKQKGNVFSLSGDLQVGFNVTYGIDTVVIRYAAIQELGGFIKHKGKMPYYMFHLARETGEEKWAIIGASALKKGGVNITAKPYFSPGVDQYEKTTWEAKLRRVDQQIAEIWERTQ